MSNKWAELVPIPPPEDINSDMTPVSASAMLAKFGSPGIPHPDCGKLTVGRFRQRIVTKWVGPFQTEGFDVAVERLHQAFVALKADTDWEQSDSLFNSLKSAGMLCVRKRRGSDAWSNHAWGTGVDLYCGSEVVPQGSHECHAGLLEFYPYLHAQGFYWGAEFSGKSIDGMHFELCAEVIAEIDY